MRFLIIRPLKLVIILCFFLCLQSVIFSYLLCSNLNYIKSVVMIEGCVTLNFNKSCVSKKEARGNPPYTLWIAHTYTALLKVFPPTCSLGSYDNSGQVDLIHFFVIKNPEIFVMPKEHMIVINVTCLQYDTVHKYHQIT